MRIIGNAGKAREVQAVASGVLPSGQPVVVNADGTVSTITGQSEELGSSVVFEAARARYISSVFDSNSNKVVIVYSDQDNGSAGTAIVGTVSGTSISFGSPATFTSDASYISAAFDSNSNKVVISYGDPNNSVYGTSVVGTVSGTSISFGTPVVFNSSGTDEIGATFDSNSNKVVVAYRDDGNSSYGTAIVGTVSGTSISFGSEAVFESANSSIMVAVFDNSNNKVVITYKDGGNSNYGTAVVGTVSGTSISFGTPVVFNAASTEAAAAFDSNANKVVIGYGDASNSSYGTAIVGTVSGTSISFGSPSVIFEDSSDKMSGAFDSGTNQVVFVFYDNGATTSGQVTVVQVSGSSISASSPTTFFTGRINYPSAVYDSNAGKTVFSYYTEDGSPAYGYSAVFQAGSTTLTSENYIGMSGGVVNKTTALPQEVGDPVVFESAVSDFISATFDSNSNKVVIAYTDDTNSGYGTAVVGTVSGTAISFGSPVVFESGYATETSCVFDTNLSKIVVVYRDNDNSSFGTAVVGTVSGTSISFGTPVVFESANSTDFKATFDSNSNKVVVAYKDLGNSSYGTAIVGTVSGTSISFGSAAVFESASTADIGIAFDSSSNKVVIGYQDGGNSQYGTAIVGTVSGTSISFGSAAVFESAEVSETSLAFDSANNKVVIAYRDHGNLNYGTAIVGTVSGTSISFGTPAGFESATTVQISAAFDSASNKVVVAYVDSGNSNHGTVVVGTVSGTSISFETPVVFESASTSYVGSTFDSNSNRVVLAYKDVGNSNYGTSTVFQTAGNYLVSGEVADGDKAEINIKGAVDENQSGLTAGQSYYVQTDGTLGTTPADPSVFAGTAVAATKLIVKG
jgi:hypothetical protein